ncbi:TlpA disulfide reductase family protein [uncultured Aquimarina sp.]|uniref:TlpA disulfide reductase family protein n=1 Tax=uncultured Aquimarina sp. TaxID=575652 RepID=UPI002611E051|nr:TlpA disulfide reductase family protein [uncultured Aquimarina sp.]
MNFKKYFFIGLSAVTFTFFSCKQKQQNEQTDDIHTNTETNGYQIIGNLKNIPDSTWVYLHEHNTVKDSALVISEKFEFTGSVDEPSKRNIRLKNGKSISFWIENKTIEIKSNKNDFSNTIIRGGKIQEESLLLKKPIDSIFDEITQVHKLFENQNLTKYERDSLVKRQNTLFEEIKNINIKFIKDHPNSYVSISRLDGYASNWGKATTKTLFEPLSEELKASHYGKSIKHFISLPEVPKIGEKFIDFELVDINGKSIKISDGKSKYALIEFWASWCYPCRKENPNLIKTYSTYKDKGFEIIGVSIDNDKKNWIDAIKKDSLPWKQGVDLKGFKSDIALTYGINGIPDNFLIDEQGIIVAKTLRGNALENKLKELFTE